MKLTADEQLIKEAILDEVDGHRYRLYGGPLATHGVSEDSANKERMDLVVRVINRIRRAKAPETVEVPGIGRLVTRRGLREIAAKYKLSDADREEIRKAKEAGLIRDDWWADVPTSLVEMLTEPGVKVSAIGVDRQPRGHSLSVEAERELRDNPPPMVFDDVDERDVPRKLDPRSTSEIVSTLVREVAEDLYGLAGYARNMHLGAARVWEHVADIEQRRVSCECFNPVQNAQAATARANEATKAAPPNPAAFAACTAALTACALKDAPAAAEAHQRAAEAYSAKEGENKA